MMSTVTKYASHEHQSPVSSTENRVANLRVWPAVVLTIAFWGLLYANHALEMSAGTRFVSRMLGYGIAFLAFFGWWLSRSKIRWRDRLLAIAVTIVFGAIALQFADKSINAFALLLTSFPIVMTVWTAWLVVSRSLDSRVGRIGFCVAMFFTLS